MEHFHSDWTLKQITMLHVNAPTDPVFRSMRFNRFKTYLLYFSFVCLFLLMDTNSIYSVSPVKWDILKGLFSLLCESVSSNE